MATDPKPKIAIWAITANGLKIARRLRERWPEAILFHSKRLSERVEKSNARDFDRLTGAVADQFNQFDGHVFIMATGIVVRTIASLLEHKGVDPGVVVVDDRGRFCISLTAGHLGGANVLANQAALCLGARPVITTATDINGKPAIDLLAGEYGLKIENPSCIKAVNMALLAGTAIRLHDPHRLLENRLPGAVAFNSETAQGSGAQAKSPTPGVWIGDTVSDLSPDTLVLRPPTLVAGIGCNRNTSQQEIGKLLLDILDQFDLSFASLVCLASIDLKSDEQGMIDLAVEMGLPLYFFTKEELARVDNVPTPSTMVTKHIGVPSVCEAAAILASQNGRLIVPKHNTKNVTVAIARTASMSWGSDRGT